MSRPPAYGSYRRRSPANLIVAALIVALVGYATGWHPFDRAAAGPAQADATAAHATPPAPACAKDRCPALAGADKAVAFAERQVGDAYVWKGDGPSASGGWDCSGLVTAAWATAGRTIPRYTQGEWRLLKHTDQLRPGVLILYDSPPAYAGETQPGHVALYIGHRQMVEAYDIAVGVRKTPLRHGWRALALPVAA